jgi:deoxyribodipyrimidine photolyase-like uncharacterized protein
MESYKTIRLILGDQLNHKHSWYEQKDPDTLYVLMECLSETNYVRHHIQKIIGFFLAMRHFSEHLKKEGHEVFYLRLDDDRNQPVHCRQPPVDHRGERCRIVSNTSYRTNIGWMRS